MRTTPVLLLCALLCINSPPPCRAQSRGGKSANDSGLFIRPEQIRVYFSPKGGCTQAIVEEIRNAKQFILIQAYSFTSAPIAGALVAAFRSGVRVEAVLDKSNKTANYSEATFLKNANVPTWIDGKHAIAHNKIIIIDGNTVITGSFNFTKAGEESNAENLLIIQSAELAARSIANFQEHKAHSEWFTGSK
jgi:phosphatidylserine/phosphatidylglycerophosphate/cardiolipin synthase-like enzyme